MILALVAALAGLLVAASFFGREAPLDLSILRSASDGELRPAVWRAGQRLSITHRVYQVHLPFKEAVVQTARELKAWGKPINMGSHQEWTEPPGALMHQGRVVQIWKHRIDPDSKRLVAPMDDPVEWSTVVVREGVPDENLFRGAWRWVTGTR